MEITNIIKGMKFKKSKKDGLKSKEDVIKAYAKYIYDYQSDIIDFYIKKSFNPKFKDTVAKLYEKMTDVKFAQALEYILKKAKKDAKKGVADPVHLDPGFAVIINGYLEQAHHREDADENAELFDMYFALIRKLLKKKSEKIAEKVGIDDAIVREILVFAPSKEYISSDKYVGVYSQRMLVKLYILAQDKTKEIGLTETKQVKKLFKAIFGEKLLDLIAVHILLEKKERTKNYNDSQLAIWNLMTRFALETIEKQEKKHIHQLIKLYVTRRKNDARNNKDAARRVNMLSGLSADYKNINKIVGKLSDEDKKYL
jgi:hypothetical protein